MRFTITFFTLLFFIFEICAQSASEYLETGISKSKLNNYKGAISDYTNAIKLNYSIEVNLASYINRGLAKQYLDDHIGAIADFNESIKIVPKYDKPYYSRGYSKAILGDLRGAIADFNTSIELNPEDSNPYFNRGSVNIN